ncbi:MAG: phosphoribosylformylglycinamidine synthase subunit PurQ [Alistipes shahii]
MVERGAGAPSCSRNGQVAFQYADAARYIRRPEAPCNPNGSSYAIEGIVSRGRA